MNTYHPNPRRNPLAKRLRVEGRCETGNDDRRERRAKGGGIFFAQAKPKAKIVTHVLTDKAASQTRST